MSPKFVLLALLGLATLSASSAATAPTASSSNLGDALLKYLDAWKQLLRCGLPAYNTPVMAPFTTPFQYFNYIYEGFSLVGNVSNLRLSGLDNFNVLGGSYDERTQSGSYDIVFSKLHLLSEYSIDGWISVAGFKVPFVMNGILDEKLVDLRFVGSFTLGPNKYNANGLTISDYDLKIYLADVELHNWNQLWNIALNNFNNDVSTTTIKMLMQQVQPHWNAIFARYVLPILDAQLQDVSMPQLVSYINEQANFCLQNSVC